jgi:hypothetical protein
MSSVVPLTAGMRTFVEIARLDDPAKRLEGALEGHPHVMWRLIESVGLTVLSAAGMTVALAHESVLFCSHLALAFGLGGAALVRRTLSS